jgi:predicted metalloprotease with PDZ domain
MEAFDRDWVAAHELSHLFHPHLGDAGAWLAEGLATWYQNLLRARAGLLTPEQAWRELDAGFARGQAGTPARSTLTLEQASTRMGANHDYMRVYWSGTAYWLAAELELDRRGLPGIDRLLQRFDRCCLHDAQPWSPRDFVARLDQLGGDGVLGRLYDVWHARLDFPAIEPLYHALGLRRSAAALRFDDEAAQAGLRASLMRAPSPASAPSVRPARPPGH